MQAKPYINKLLLVFVWARRVNHYYWMHTDGDAADAVSIQNLHRVVSRLAKLNIQQLIVDFDGSTLRGNFERYDDRVVIHVRESQSENWQRFTVVKELCHVLLDEMEDWSTDVVSTISGLLSFAGFEGEESAAIRSEKAAEIMALELVYPLEVRAEDRAFLDAGGKVAELADRRKVPPLWIERALDPKYLEVCQDMWRVLNEVPPDRDPLPDEVPAPQAAGV